MKYKKREGYKYKILTPQYLQKYQNHHIEIKIKKFYLLMIINIVPYNK